MNLTTYEKQLTQMEDIRKVIGSNAGEIDIPQIVVIGNQSSGKSSLLSELTGISFPEASGICTKCPIYVRTINADIETPEYTVEDEGKEISLSKEELCGKILEIQKKATSMFKVTETPINITVKGRQFQNLALVDLPGMIQYGYGIEEVKKMIRKYIAPKQSLILLVTEAKVNDENSEAIGFAKEYDPYESRTIRILTKFDRFDSDKEDDTGKAYAKDLVSNVSEYSPHAVVCRPNTEQYTIEGENGVLSQYNLPTERSGVESLKERLPKLLCELINKNIPHLEEQLNEQLSANKSKLIEIGEKAPDSTQIVANVQESLTTTFDDKKSVITHDLIETFREDMHNTHKLINVWHISKYYRFDSTKCPYFQGEATFNQILKVLVNTWMPIIEKLHKDIDAFLKELFDLSDASTLSDELKQSIRKSWKKCYTTFMKTKLTEMEEECKKERRFKTMNHYLDAKYIENETFPEEVMDGFIESITKDIYCKEDRYIGSRDKTDVALSKEKVQENIQKLLEDAIEKHANEQHHMSIEERHKDRILSASRANWAVSHKNLCDNILSIICEIKDSTDEWIKSIMSDDNIRSKSGEHPSIKKDRIKYTKNISKMKECLDILNEN